MRNYLYKGNSARIYRLFKFYQTAIIFNIWYHLDMGSLSDSDMYFVLFPEVYAIALTTGYVWVVLRTDLDCRDTHVGFTSKSYS